MKKVLDISILPNWDRKWHLEIIAYELIAVEIFKKGLDSVFGFQISKYGRQQDLEIRYVVIFKEDGSFSSQAIFMADFIIPTENVNALSQKVAESLYRLGFRDTKLLELSYQIDSHFKYLVEEEF